MGSMRKLTLGILMMMCALCLGGCIRRMATVSSDPPGAKVWINGVYRGETPVEIPYNWNWYYDIRVEKDGYERLTARERFYAPVQHWVPLDLATEVLPVRSQESQYRHYVLKPKGEI
jgi:hypothetical protein